MVAKGNVAHKGLTVAGAKQKWWDTKLKGKLLKDSGSHFREYGFGPESNRWHWRVLVGEWENEIFVHNIPSICNPARKEEENQIKYFSRLPNKKKVNGKSREFPNFGKVL